MLPRLPRPPRQVAQLEDFCEDCRREAEQSVQQEEGALSQGNKTEIPNQRILQKQKSYFIDLADTEEVHINEYKSNNEDENAREIYFNKSQNTTESFETVIHQTERFCKRE